MDATRFHYEMLLLKEDCASQRAARELAEEEAEVASIRLDQARGIVRGLLDTCALNEDAMDPKDMEACTAAEKFLERTKPL